MGNAAGARFDQIAAEQAVVRVVAGDSRVFTELVRLLWPELMSLLESSRRLGERRRCEDDRRELGVLVVEKLARDDFHGLRLYAPWAERHPDKSFHDWLKIVVANAARDYLRSLGRKPSESEPDVSQFRLLNDFANSRPLDEIGSRPPVTAAQTARQLLEFASSELSPEQYEGLVDWLQGGTFDEIAARLGLEDPRVARKLVRAAVATLRRRFQDGTQRLEPKPD